MLPLAHVAAGVILYKLLGLTNPIYLVIGVAAATAIDLDFLLAKNHRKLPTHSPLAYLPTLPLLFVPALKIIPLALYSHLALDSIDYGVNLRPLTEKLKGIKLLSKRKNLKQYIIHYLKSRVMLLELALIGAALLIYF